MQLSIFKHCPRCDKTKLVTEFVKDKTRKDNRYPICKSCVEQHRQENYAEWQESHRATQHRHKDKYQQQTKEWRINNKERNAELKRAWEIRNKDLLNQRAREQAQLPETRERRNKRNQKYLDNHPEKRKQFKSNRRARELSAGEFTGAEWLALCEKYGNVCLCCRESKPLTPDHVIPISKGGSNTIDNIQPLCLRCNQKKHTRTIDYR